MVVIKLCNHLYHVSLEIYHHDVHTGWSINQMIKALLYSFTEALDIVHELDALGEPHKKFL